MKNGRVFAEGIKLITGLNEELRRRDLSDETLRRLTDSFKKWHGFHTPHGIQIGSETLVAKMGQRSILLYQLWINTQLMATDLQSQVEKNLLMCLAHWQRFEIHTAIQEENPDKLAGILQCDPNNLLIKTFEDTGEWWLLRENPNLAMQPV